MNSRASELSNYSKYRSSQTTTELQKLKQSVVAEEFNESKVIDYATNAPTSFLSKLTARKQKASLEASFVDVSIDATPKTPAPVSLLQFKSPRERRMSNKTSVDGKNTSLFPYARTRIVVFNQEETLCEQL